VHGVRVTGPDHEVITAVLRIVVSMQVIVAVVNRVGPIIVGHVSGVHRPAEMAVRRPVVMATVDRDLVSIAQGTFVGDTQPSRKTRARDGGSTADATRPVSADGISTGQRRCG